MVKTIKDRALFELTLRKYEKAGAFSERELSRRICLSLGLLHPGDSRDVVVDVMLALLKASAQKKCISSKEVEDFVYFYRDKNNLPLAGITPSNINRQLRRIKEIGFLDKTENGFRLREFLSLKEIFDEYFIPHILDPLIERLRSYLSLGDEVFGLDKREGSQEGREG